MVNLNLEQRRFLLHVFQSKVVIIVQSKVNNWFSLTTLLAHCRSPGSGWFYTTIQFVLQTLHMTYMSVKQSGDGCNNTSHPWQNRGSEYNNECCYYCHFGLESRIQLTGKKQLLSPRVFTFRVCDIITMIEGRQVWENFVSSFTYYHIYVHA